MTKGYRVVAILWALLALMPCGGAQSLDEALVAAAKSDGKVVFYTSFLGSPLHLGIIKSFEQTYGIPVELLDVRASEMLERIRTEQAAGRFLGDVIQNGSATLLRQERDSQLRPHGDIPNLKNLLPDLSATDIRVPSYILPYGILINTRLVPPSEEPKSWADLLDPRWKGKILADDLRAIGGGSITFAAFHDRLGVEFLRKLAAQDLVFSRDVGNDERRVARGEFPLRFPELFSSYLLLKGLPVKLVVPLEGAPYVRFDMALLKNAPHPNAARLFIDFYLGEQTQLTYANAALKPVVKGVAEKASPDMQALANVKLLGTSNADTQQEMLNLAAQIFK
ncbi:MAG: ABC transporter substrate-binding protein [Hyphomicrobiales bacterium]